MTRTIVAIYDDYRFSSEAVKELVDRGFPRDNISLVTRNAGGAAGGVSVSETDTVADETGAGAGVGAGIGAALGGIGGLLVGLGALTIPGIGPVLAAGPLAVALSTLTGAGVGAVAGGVTGGLLGALIGLGIPEEEAEYYAEGVRRGGVLLTVQADEQNTDEIIDILNRYNPIDIHERATSWRKQGWTGFHPDEEPAQTTANRQPGVIANTGSTADVDVEDRSQVAYSGTIADFDPENPVYMNHYNTYLAETGYPYEHYVPAYQYGHGLASDARYKNKTWEMIESDVRRNWEREHQSTWDRFKNAKRHSRENATGQDQEAYSDHY